MELLDYLKASARFEQEPHSDADVRIAIVTNTTDDLLKKLLTGMCVSEGIVPDIYQTPFKQYLFAVKDPGSALMRHQADLTFMLFDANPYLASEFILDAAHAGEVLEDAESYAKQTKGEVVIATIPAPASLQHMRLLSDSNQHALAESFAARVRQLARDLPNVHVLDADALVRLVGESHVRDLRGLYAFGQPFSHEFIFAVAREWMTHVRARLGRLRKCIVLDMDGVLWGGIAGEVGSLGIVLGPDYPGNAYREFQRALLSLHDRGVILALNSRNNLSDVEEVFEKNRHMILAPKHFAAMAINWNDKAENLRNLAKEINIGLDSMIFIDDDPANRELIRAQLPDVFVPEWSMPPEEYVRYLLALDVFDNRPRTEEDAKRGVMYAAERKRKALADEMPSLQEYIKSLSITIAVSLNDESQVPRLAQLTQKTNQYNLSTRRLTEGEIRELMRKGAYVYGGGVQDKFGDYGLTVMAILEPENSESVSLTTFLMSCRVMGRGVEKDFFTSIAKSAFTEGYRTLTASYIPSTKNAPIRGFLPGLGAQISEEKESGEIIYSLSLSDYLQKNP